MKLKKKTTVKKPAAKVEEAVEETLEDQLAEMDRKALKAYIKEEELEVRVTKGMSDDDIREKITEQFDSATGADEGAEDEDEDDPVDTGDEDEDDDPPAEDEDADADEDAVELSELDRKELKAFIKEQELDIRVLKSMSDDDLRQAIADSIEALGGSEEDDAEPAPAAAPSGDGALSWMYQGAKLEEEAAASAAQADAGFAPEFWVKDGTSSVVRFRDDEPVCGLYMYSFYNGKRWAKETQSGDPSEDMFAKEGKRPVLYLIYELLDRTGYKNRDGKTLKDVPKYWLVNDRIHRQLQHIRTKKGSLSKFDLEIHREGGKKPVYTIMPDDALGDLSTKAKKQPRLGKAGIEKYYSPSSVDEQRRMLRVSAEQDD